MTESQRPPDMAPEVWAKTLAGQVEKLHEAILAFGRALAGSLPPSVRRLMDRYGKP